MAVIVVIAPNEEPADLAREPVQKGADDVEVNCDAFSWADRNFLVTGVLSRKEVLP